MDLNKIEKLNELREKGAITEEEYQQAKKKALGETSLSEAASNLDSESYSMIMHLTQLCSFVIPFSGAIIPIVMWLIKKENAYIDQQGKVIANWIISALIYFAISVVLTVIVIGAFLIAALIICSVVFAIVGAIRAKDGVVKNYPLAISFFRVEPTPLP